MSARLFLISLLSASLFLACQNQNHQKKESQNAELKIRPLADTIGFTQYPWQMDSLVSRMAKEDKIPSEDIYKMAICPHDDYSYAGGLYNKTLEGVKAKTIVLIGVAHKAKIFNLENKLVFDSFDAWKGTYGTIPISPIRQRLLNILPPEIYQVHDSMMQIEHSLEAITPFLQKNIKGVEIIPILVPYFSFENMEAFSDKLAMALRDIMLEYNLLLGKDLAIVISNDAIHYGDRDWGGSNMAPFGVDSAGTARVIQKEMEIISNCLEGDLNAEKIKRFNQYTVEEADFKEYKWTWCGRYAVPFGLMLGNKLNNLIEQHALMGTLIDYRSSLHNPHIDVSDIGMGTTAPANQRHWVGYVGMAYE